MSTSCSMTAPCGKATCSFCNRAHPANAYTNTSVLKLASRARTAVRYLSSLGYPPAQIFPPVPRLFIQHADPIMQLQGRLMAMQHFMNQRGIASPQGFRDSVAPTRLTDLRRDGILARILREVVIQSRDFQGWPTVYRNTELAATYGAIEWNVLSPLQDNQFLYDIAVNQLRSLTIFEAHFNETHRLITPGYTIDEPLLFQRDPARAVTEWMAFISPYLHNYTNELRLRITLGSRTSESMIYTERHNERLSNALELITRLEQNFRRCKTFKIELFIPTEHDTQDPRPWYAGPVDLRKARRDMNETEKEVYDGLVMCVKRVQGKLTERTLLAIVVQDQDVARGGVVSGKHRTAMEIVDRLVRRNEWCEVVEKE